MALQEQRDNHPPPLSGLCPGSAFDGSTFPKPYVRDVRRDSDLMDRRQKGAAEGMAAASPGPAVTQSESFFIHTRGASPCKRRMLLAGMRPLPFPLRYPSRSHPAFVSPALCRC
uniref:Uncharacterized protein n=1 Tax=Zosterops lateralis melanops TaxID=1220523 RepID=A0A8D2QR74_ZOSLA